MTQEATISHSSHPAAGQLRLTLPPRLTEEDNIVVAGYRVFCSTNRSMTPDVPCYDGLVPVEAKEATLRLSDTSKPVYATVKVVRNFNGAVLQEEGNFLVTNQSLCPGGIFK